MELIRDVCSMQVFAQKQRAANKVIGLVPTMGYFHEGHLTLMRRAKETCDIVIVSLFVNPLQFGAGEDFHEYPRDLARDQNLAVREGVDVFFLPSQEEFYSQGYSTYVQVTGLTDNLCGKSRPGHFQGVATVVAKLFNSTLPDYAFFGQKDIQQALVMRRMTLDLNFPLEIVIVPTVREEDGLAMSSRNVYLSPEERKSAPVLSRSLECAASLIATGERDAAVIKQAITSLIAQEDVARVDYLEVCDAESLAPVTRIQGKIVVALAVWMGRTRLIDNIMVEV
jgi:pantoate--beta-alanine ligase